MRRVLTAALAALILHSLVVIYIAERVSSRQRWYLLLTMDHPLMLLGNTQRAELAVQSCLVLGGAQSLMITLVSGCLLGTWLAGRENHWKFILAMALWGVCCSLLFRSWLYFPAVVSALVATGMGAAIWLGNRRGAWTPLVLPGMALLTVLIRSVWGSG